MNTLAPPYGSLRAGSALRQVWPDGLVSLTGKRWQRCFDLDRGEFVDERAVAIDLRGEPECVLLQLAVLVARQWRREFSTVHALLVADQALAVPEGHFAGIVATASEIGGGR